MNVVDLNEARLRKADEEFGQRMIISSVFVPRLMSQLPTVRRLVNEGIKQEVLLAEEKRMRMDAEVTS